LTAQPDHSGVYVFDKDFQTRGGIGVGHGRLELHVIRQPAVLAVLWGELYLNNRVSASSPCRRSGCRFLF
jgi:hypothetical protein